MVNILRLHHSLASVLDLPVYKKPDGPLIGSFWQWGREVNLAGDNDVSLTQRNADGTVAVGDDVEGNVALPVV